MPAVVRRVRQSPLPAGLAAWLAILGISLATPVRAADAPTGRVVVIGVDGGSWNLVQPLLEAGELPQLAKLGARGITADLSTVKPVISPTVWTSIATGRSPAAHGVRSFFSTSLDVRVPTLFERLAADGARVGLYDWLVTWPPTRLPDGFVIPGWTRRDARTSPEDAFARAGATPYVWDVDALRTPAEFAAAAREEVAEKPERFVRLLRAFAPQVAGVTFYCVDATSHRFWQAAFPEQFEGGAGRAPDPRYGRVIHDALVGVDRAIGQIVDALAPEDHVLVLSDHGFQADARGRRHVWVSHPEAFVARAGLDPARDGFRANGFAFFVVRVLPGPFAEREATLAKLERLLASARSLEGEPLFRLYALDVAERPAGVEPAPGRERSWRRRAEALALRAYLWWMDTALDQPAHAYLVGAPDGALLERLWPDGMVKLGEAQLPLRELVHADDFTGTHDATGIFFAAGPALRHDARRLAVSVLDVAPIVLQLAARALPDDLERPLRGDLLEPAWLAVHPPRGASAAAWPTIARPASDEALRGARDASEEAVKQRLRALGYVQ